MDKWRYLTAAIIPFIYLSIIAGNYIRLKKRGVNAAVTPKNAFERVVWWLWTAVFAAWILIPHIAQNNPQKLLLQDWMTGWWAIAACSGIVLSLIVTIWSYKTLDVYWAMSSESDPKRLICEGPYNYVRHPVYVVQWLLLFSCMLLVPTWILLIVCSLHAVLIKLKTAAEEKVLTRAFAQEYPEYKKKVPALFPLIRPK